MSTSHVVASRTYDPNRQHAGFLGTGVIVVDAFRSGGLVNLDLGRAVPVVEEAYEEGDRWVSLTAAEARALAAVLNHYAEEVER